MKTISHLVAVSNDLVIGVDNDLPWNLKDDLAHFKKYTLNKDKRGEFVELIRSEIGGQMSFSTTKSKVVRGNHYHTRKIERFSVIKGTAEIKIRKINTDEIISYIVSGENPSYIDMPIWYTHNIKNIGKEDLFTNFWINEPFNPDSPDTYMEIV